MKKSQEEVCESESKGSMNDKKEESSIADWEVIEGTALSDQAEASPSPDGMKRTSPAVFERTSPSPEIIKKPPPAVKEKPRKAADGVQKDTSDEGKRVGNVVGSVQLASLASVLQRGPPKHKVCEISYASVHTQLINELRLSEWISRRCEGFCSPCLCGSYSKDNRHWL